MASAGASFSARASLALVPATAAAATADPFKKLLLLIAISLPASRVINGERGPLSPHGLTLYHSFSRGVMGGRLRDEGGGAVRRSVRVARGHGL